MINDFLFETLNLDICCHCIFSVISLQEEELQRALQNAQRELQAVAERDASRGSVSPEQRIRDLEGQLEREKMMKMTVCLRLV